RCARLFQCLVDNVFELRFEDYQFLAVRLPKVTGQASHLAYRETRWIEDRSVQLCEPFVKLGIELLRTANAVDETVRRDVSVCRPFPTVTLLEQRHQVFRG